MACLWWVHGAEPPVNRTQSANRPYPTSSAALKDRDGRRLGKLHQLAENICGGGRQRTFGSAGSDGRRNARGQGFAMVEGRLGRPPLAAKREQFARLIARGVGNAEACRIVGVHPKTGKRWRRGRVMTSSSGARLQYAPVISTRKQVISQRYLSQDDRVSIADLAGAGFRVRAIAAQLGRSPSTVSRELRRNRDHGSGQYRPFAAQLLAARRRARPGRGKLLRDPVLREFVAGRVTGRWGPQQVSQALRGEFPGDA